jgi:hypothetical protein
MPYNGWAKVFVNIIVAEKTVTLLKIEENFFQSTYKVFAS